MMKNYQKMEIKKFIETITTQIIYRKYITEERLSNKLNNLNTQSKKYDKSNLDNYLFMKK